MKTEAGFHVDDVNWLPLRGLAISAAAFKPLADAGYTGGAFDLELTRIGPGGSSTPHREPWSHLFYVLEGEGKLDIQGALADMAPGTVHPVRAGDLHHLTNTGKGDLVMLVLYHPARKRNPANAT
jgi:mannose-6-phosphate isomerase-like protein (cupin superfamily)